MKMASPAKVVDLASLARFILSPECNSISILTGAGVSVASGIPDFRSPGGLYDTLRPELLTAPSWQQQLMTRDPTNVVNWEIFRDNSFPYLEVRRPFILGTRNHQWKATIAHRFAELLQTKTQTKLTRVYTQNIDGLQHQCDELPLEKIVNVHGTISEASCEGCGHDMNFDAFCDKVQSNIKDIYAMDSTAPSDSTPIVCPKCSRALVKPRTVLFGRSLPIEFFERIQDDLPTCDLLIIAGTSLVVSPANSLVYQVPKHTIRVVINNEPVGQELGIDYGPTPRRDFFAQGDCETVFLNLIQELGWLQDLKSKMDKLPPRSVELLQSR
jgi:NAD+-dependent protein deacetylase sirtuin 2